MESQIQCLDCSSNKQNNSLYKYSEIINHLINYHHEMVCIPAKYSITASTLKLECSNCKEQEIFKLKIQMNSKGFLLFCDSCAFKMRGNQQQDQQQQSSSSSNQQQQYQRVVINNAINLYLFKKISSVLNSQPQQQQLQPQFAQSQSSQNMDVRIGAIKQQGTLYEDSRILNKNEQQSQNSRNIQEEVNIINQQPQQNNLNNQNSNNINGRCLDCSISFDCKIQDVNNPSSIINHMLKTRHNSMKLYYHPYYQTVDKPECKICHISNVFQLNIIVIDKQQYLVCQKCCLLNVNILNNKEAHQNISIGVFRQGSFVVNNQYVNPLYFREEIVNLDQKSSSILSSDIKSSEQFNKSSNVSSRNNNREKKKGENKNNNNVSNSNSHSNNNTMNMNNINPNRKGNINSNSSSQSINNNNNNNSNINQNNNVQNNNNRVNYVQNNQNNYNQSNNNQSNSIGNNTNSNGSNSNNNNSNNNNGNNNNNNESNQVQTIDTTVACHQCKNTFSNQRRRQGEITQIVKHLKKTQHQLIEISTTAAKTNLRKFQCLCCKTKQLFILQVVDVCGNIMVLCKNCIDNNEIKIRSQENNSQQILQLKNYSSTPVILDGAINSQLMNLDVKENNQQLQIQQNENEKELEDEDIEIIVNSQNQQTNENNNNNNNEQKKQEHIPFSFKNYELYYQHFNKLMQQEKEDQLKKMKLQVFKSSQVVIMDDEGTIEVPEHISLLKFKEGDSLELNSRGFYARCYIESIKDNNIIVTIEGEEGRFSNRRTIRDVKVSPVFLDIIFQRIKDALKNFKDLDKQLQKSLLQGIQNDINQFRRNESFESGDSLDSLDSIEIIENSNNQINSSISSSNNNSSNNSQARNQNKKIELNKSQKQALQLLNKQNVTLIQGPPGTGKTETAAQLIVNLCKQREKFRTKKILVCAPSNLASDNIANRIYELDNQVDIIRIVSLHRQRVQKHYKHDNIILHKLASKKQDINKILNNCQVVCTTCINAVDKYIKNKYTFDTVIIDESNQAIEPECLIPLQNEAKNLILVGDHKQLPPIILSTISAKNGLKKSLFSRLIQLGHIPLFLENQYRMHPQICKFSSTVFYDSKLLSDKSTNERIINQKFPWNNNQIPVQFYDLIGKETTHSDGCSYYNEGEARQVLELTKQLIISGVNQNDIGIIAAYSSQVDLIKSKLNKASIKSILIDTVHSFQGKEKEYIILSCVRSNNYEGLGVLRSYQLINVSITRARSGMLIVGNKEHLKNSKWWKQILEMMEKDNIIVKCNSIDNLQRLTALDNNNNQILETQPDFIQFQKIKK